MNGLSNVDALGRMQLESLGMTGSFKKAKALELSVLERCQTLRRTCLAPLLQKARGARQALESLRLRVRDLWILDFRREIAAETRVGGVVQVRYLYAAPGHRLYQPTLDASSGSVFRLDKRPAECLLAQLKYEGQD